MIAPKPIDDTPALSQFDAELRSLPSVALGTAADILREDVSVLHRRAKRDGWSAGWRSCETFLEWVIQSLERESARRDREGSR